jgi:hypothetical protein
MHWIALLPPEGEHTAWGWRALQFTPRVAQVDEALVLEVSASHRLWGGPDRLLRRLFRPNHAAARVEYARAATYLIAIALLRLQRQGLAVPPAVPDGLPLSTLTAAQPWLDTLARTGCRQWGQLRALPRGGVARRFGAPLLEALDTAYGERPAACVWLTLPEVFDASLELPALATTAPGLMWAAQRLLLQLQAWLRARDRGALALQLQWTLDLKRLDGVPLPPHESLTVRTAQPAQDINFSFQRGASHPKELVARAAQLGYQALALTDECSVAGVVRAWEAAKECGLHLIVGSEFVWGDLRLVALARDAQGWGNLCEFITAARAAAPKGQYHVGPGSPFSLLQGCELLLAPCRERMDASDFVAVSACLSSARAQFGLNFDGHLWLAVELHLAPDDSLWLATLQRAGAALGLPLVAAGDVHMHARSRKPLQDVITAVQRGCSVAECGFALQPNAERHLRQRVRLAGIYPPELLAATLTVAARCTFSLGEIRYQYPLETVPPA